MPRTPKASCQPLKPATPQGEIPGRQPAFHPGHRPRYTEASLIKTLEENGIGRPSTYAPTITTILARGYIEREQKALKPTILG